MMMKLGKAAGLSGLVLTVTTMGILGVNTLASATSSPDHPSKVSSSTGLGAGTGANAGCAATRASLPAGANKAKTVDVDGDGRSDTLWNSGDRFGVHTASGATFSGAFANIGGPAASVETITLGDGSKVIMELGRLDYVNAVINCKIVATKNKQGHQYAFDHGFLRAGASWGLATINGKKQLVGLQLKTVSAADGFYGVVQTPIVLHEHGKRATNGKVGDLTHNGRAFMSKSTANEKIAALVKTGRSSKILTSPGA
jgi:hypothetical protein